MNGGELQEVEEYSIVLLISTYTQQQPRMRLMQRNRLFYSIRGDVAASYAQPTLTIYQCTGCATYSQSSLSSLAGKCKLEANGILILWLVRRIASQCTAPRRMQSSAEEMKILLPITRIIALGYLYLCSRLVITSIQAGRQATTTVFYIFRLRCGFP